MSKTKQLLDDGDVIFNPALDKLVKLGAIDRQQAHEWSNVTAKLAYADIYDFYDDGRPAWWEGLLERARHDSYIHRLLNQATQVAENSQRDTGLGCPGDRTHPDDIPF